MDATTLEQLKTCLKSLRGSYRETKSQAEAAVGYWRWATDRYFSLIPFEQERFRMVRGKLLDVPPQQPKNCCAFGFDDQDRLRVVRVLDAEGKPQTEQFTAHEADRSLTKGYLSGGKSVGKVVQMTFQDGLPQTTASLGAAGDWLSETYRYSQGQLASIDVEQFHAKMKKTFSHRYEFSYPSTGRCQATRIEADGKRAVAFDAEHIPMDNLKVLLTQFEDELATAIHSLARAFNTSRVAYCLALSYGDDPSGGCVPVVGLGFLNAAEDITSPTVPLSAHEEGLWNPAEFSSFGDATLQPRAATVVQLDQALRSAAQAGSSIDLRALCLRLAARLNHLDWSPLRTSGKFIVYAVDDDLAHLEENLVAAASSLHRHK